MSMRMKKIEKRLRKEHRERLGSGKEKDKGEGKITLTVYERKKDLSISVYNRLCLIPLSFLFV